MGFSEKTSLHHAIILLPCQIWTLCCFKMSSWCFLCYMGLRDELFASQCFIRDLYNTLCHGSINHCMKSHGYISFYSLLPFDFIYFAWVAPWSWKGLEDMEKQNRLSWNSWSEIASWTQHTQISLGTDSKIKIKDISVSPQFL